MNQYFFKMSQAEKNKILDQHKTIYDGFVTQYGRSNNEQPLYVQDFANDKNGLVVSNTGNVKPYTNMGINENFNHLDQIGDSDDDLENGTVDLDGINDIDLDMDFISLGSKIENDEEEHYDDLRYQGEFEDDDEFNDFGDDEIDFFLAADSTLEDDVPENIKESFTEKWNETLSMFNRIIK